MTKDRYVYEGDRIRDLTTGRLLSDASIIARLNSYERVLARVIEVVEQREEA